MTLPDSWGNIFPSAIPLSVVTLLLSLGAKPAFGNYFNLARYYNSGSEKIKISGKLQATDLDADGKISISEVETFEGVVVYQNEKKSDTFSLFDLREENLEQSDYYLSNYPFDFSVPALDTNQHQFINSINYSNWQVGVQPIFDVSWTQDVHKSYFNSQLTNVSNQNKHQSPLDSLGVLLILVFSLLRISQQLNSESKQVKNPDSEISTQKS